MINFALKMELRDGILINDVVLRLSFLPASGEQNYSRNVEVNEEIQNIWILSQNYDACRVNSGKSMIQVRYSVIVFLSSLPRSCQAQF